MLRNDRMETASTEVTSIQHRKEVSKFPHRIDIVISTWICLSKSK